MLKKNILFLICLVWGFVSVAKVEDNPNVGVLIVNNVAIDSSWSYLSAMVEFFLDDNIKVIVIHLESDCSLTYSQAFSLAKSICCLKKMYKKPVVSYTEDFLRGSSYAIATSADYIMVSPLCLLGYINYHTIYPDKSALHTKDGIYINPIKAGRYKLLGDEDFPITPEDLKMLQAECEAGWKNLVRGLIELRPKLESHKDKWVNGEMFLANQMGQDTFFVDMIGDKLDLENFVLKLLNNTQKNEVIKEGCLNLKELEINNNKKDTVVVLNAMNRLKGVHSKYYFDILKNYFYDSSVLGIVINMDIFGTDSAGLMCNLYTQIKKLQQVYNKPLVAYVDGGAYSGGYWLACCTDYIITSPLSCVGSVGWRWQRGDRTKEDSLKSIKYNTISTNKFGNIFNEHTSLKKEEEALIQKVASDMHAGFIEQVKDARPKLRSNEDSWKEAQCYPAYEALNLGMIDAIGSPMAAIRHITRNRDLRDIRIVFDDLTKVEANQ